MISSVTSRPTTVYLKTLSHGDAFSFCGRNFIVVRLGRGFGSMSADTVYYLDVDKGEIRACLSEFSGVTRIQLEVSSNL